MKRLWIQAVLLAATAGALYGQESPQPAVPAPSPAVLDDASEPAPYAAPEASVGEPCTEAACDTYFTEDWDAPIDNSVRRIFPTDCNGFQLQGWIDVGYTANFDSPASRFNGPYNAVNRDRFAMNQLYLTWGKDVSPDACGFEWGGRIDALYGQDYLLAQARGLERNRQGGNGWNTGENGLALPQFYAEGAYNDLSVKLGHFYSIVGYEGVRSPYNFFYSKAYSYQAAGPFTHTGALATYTPGCWTFWGGLHNGWDGFDPNPQRLGVLGGAKYSWSDQTYAQFTITTGQDPRSATDRTTLTERTRFTALFSTEIGCGWQYVGHYWHGFQDNGAPVTAAPAAQRDAEWYGIDQYLYYTIDDCWRAGLRGEWFRDADGTRVAGALGNPNNGFYTGNFFSISAGLNWTPTTNLIVRPEIRYDWFDGQGLPYNDRTKTNQTLAACDVIWQF